MITLRIFLIEKNLKKVNKKYYQPINFKIKNNLPKMLTGQDSARNRRSKATEKSQPENDAIDENENSRRFHILCFASFV